MDLNGAVQKTLTVLLVLFGVIGGVVGANSYFAKATDLVLVSERLDIKILNDQYNNVRERMWMLEAKYGDMCKDAPPEVKKEHQKLQLELKKIERELERRVSKQWKEGG